MRVQTPRQAFKSRFGIASQIGIDRSDRSRDRRRQARLGSDRTVAAESAPDWNVWFKKAHLELAAYSPKTNHSWLPPVFVEKSYTWDYFDVDEGTLLRLTNAAKETPTRRPRNHELPLSLGLAGEEGFPHRGTLDFVSNYVDPNTGTLSMRGVFPNPARAGGAPGALRP